MRHICIKNNNIFKVYNDIMGSVIPLKKNLLIQPTQDLKNHFSGKIDSVEKLINLKLKSQVNLIKK